MIKILVAAFIFITFLSSAQDIDSVKIGSGGGFTGSVLVYKFQQKRVLKGKGVAIIKYNEKAKICGGKRKSLIKSAQIVLNEGSPIDAPGNQYQFIEVYSKNKSIKLIWSTASENNINPNVLIQVHTIKAIIQQLKFKTYVP